MVLTPYYQEVSSWHQKCFHSLTLPPLPLRRPPAPGVSPGVWHHTCMVGMPIFLETSYSVCSVSFLRRKQKTKGPRLHQGEWKVHLRAELFRTFYLAAVGMGVGRGEQELQPKSLAPTGPAWKSQGLRNWYPSTRNPFVAYQLGNINKGSSPEQRLRGWETKKCLGTTHIIEVELWPWGRNCCWFCQKVSRTLLWYLSQFVAKTNINVVL